MEKIELLAPAGGLDALKAAVENGADAVYIGAKMFSDRQNALNFDNEDLYQGIHYAHQRGGKVFAAVNTLIKNDEIAPFLNCCYELAEREIDAFIVQDLGAVKLLKEAIPDIRLHASTQMAVHNLEGVRYLEELGMERAVLARETSLKNIQYIIQNTDMEIETFVHGALCVAYSGQCLLSSFIGGRSGNRGLCAQPCRMKYKLAENSKCIFSAKEGDYLLSTKDLNLIEHLPALIDSGIHSLKIEGRMKRPEYVATVVSAYRKAIDSYYEQKNLLTKQDLNDLRQIFNRDFTQGYYFNKPYRDLMSYERPDNRGVFMGKVVEWNKGSVNIKLSLPLHENDGFLIEGKEEIAGKVQGLKKKGKDVTSADKGDVVSFVLKDKATAGASVYKTADSLLLKKALESFQTPSPVQKKKVDFYLTAKLGEPISLVAVSGEKSAQVTGEYIVTLAENRPADEEYIYKQLSRLGNSDYVLNHLETVYDNGVMLPASELNKIRRDAIDALILQEDEKTVLDKDEIYENAGEYLDTIPPKVVGYTETSLSVEVNDLSRTQWALQAGADVIIGRFVDMHGQDKFTDASLKAAVELCHKWEKPFWLGLNQIWEDEETGEIRRRLGLAKEYGVDGVLAGNVGMIHLANEMGFERIYADYSLNVFNDLSINHLLDHNISGVALSPEMNLEQIEDLSYFGNVPIELIVHGNFPLMISNYCAIGSIVGERGKGDACPMPCNKAKWTLRDRMNFDFPILTDHHCRMYVYNSKGLNLYKKINDVLSCGPDYIRIIANFMSEEEVKLAVCGYKTALNYVTRYGRVEIDPDVAEDLEKATGSTYGHYYRGVL